MDGPKATVFLTLKWVGNDFYFSLQGAFMPPHYLSSLGGLQDIPIYNCAPHVYMRKLGLSAPQSCISVVPWSMGFLYLHLRWLWYYCTSVAA